MENYGANYFRRCVKPFLIIFLLVLAFANISYAKKDSDDALEIKATITEYFEARYNSLQAREIGDLDNYFYSSGETQHEMQIELDILEIEIERDKILEVEIDFYEFGNEFSAINIDKENGIATAEFFHIFERQYTTSDSVSSVGSTHITTLIKLDGIWKIFSDKYSSSIHKSLAASSSETKKDDFIEGYRNLKKQMIDELEGAEALEPTSKATTVDSLSTVAPLSVTPPWSTYNRTAAVAYAQGWAYGFNPSFWNYSAPAYGGDCTNFASQVLLAGGAVMDSSGSHPNYRWFWFNDTPTTGRSASWTSVMSFHDYLTAPTIDWEGPFGNVLIGSNLGIRLGALNGDMVQIDKGRNGIWDHTMIIVGKEYGYFPFNPTAPVLKVAAHSDPCHDDYLLQHVGWNDRIRIIQIGGYYD